MESWACRSCGQMNAGYTSTCGRCDDVKVPVLAILTDEECMRFRQLPVSFNDMVRAIYRAGRDSK